MSFRKIIFAIQSALVAGVLAVSSVATAAEPGAAMPDWASHGLVGDMPDLEGKVVMLDFWASWCAPCKASFPAYTELQQEWADQGFVIVAVSVDRKARDYERFLQQNPVGFATLHDIDQSLAAEIRPPAMPTSYIYGRDGKLRHVHKGFRGKSTLAELRADIEPLLEESR